MLPAGLNEAGVEEVRLEGDLVEDQLCLLGLTLQDLFPAALKAASAVGDKSTSGEHPDSSQGPAAAEGERGEAPGSAAAAGHLAGHQCAALSEHRRAPAGAVC
ncbi:hypothetical protein WJX73_001633 [Symbiochloris irregularis]|uniref:Uncharacterized protein n=1 Tax=Symbiochloris irregularis TaxID=706552 RepID=A0AAW1NX27_9CHLO